MTELQPTAIELRGSKNRSNRLPRKRIIAAVAILLMITGSMDARYAIIAVNPAAPAIIRRIAYRASIDPVIIQPATLPPETDDIIVDD